MQCRICIGIRRNLRVGEYVIQGLGETGVLWRWHRNCVLCAAVLIDPGENCITLVKAQLNCAAATVTDYRVKRNAVAWIVAPALDADGHLRTFGDFTERRMMAVSYRPFGTNVWPHLQGSSRPRRSSSWNSWPLNSLTNSSSRNVGKKPAILRCIKSRKSANLRNAVHVLKPIYIWIREEEEIVTAVRQ